MRRIASYIIVALLFLGLSAFAFTVQPAKAQSGGTITINPNGSISSPAGHPANITTSDKVTYTFTGNNYLPIVVNRSNIIINGRGHTLQASASYNGFSLSSVSNVTIKNTTITNSYDGIYLESSSGNTLSGNNVTGNYEGIYLYYSSGNTLSGNNVIANSYDGIDLEYSSGNTLSGNIMASNWGNFFVFGEVLGDFVNNVSASNLVDGKPVYYLMSKSNIVISPQTCPEGVGYLGLVNCTNVTVQGLTLTKNGQGLLLAFTNDSKITSNNVTGNSYDGIFIISSSGNTLFRNRVTGNSGANGIDLYYSSGSTLSGNNVTANGGDGISFYHSSGSTLSGNNVTANGVDGIFLESFSGSTLSGNNVTANGVDGIVLYHSSGNTFFHNNFVGNAQQVSSDGSPNTWDNGYPSGGNYWSDYSGVDHKSGPGQNVTGSDGIGDTPYGIDANNIDRYPLMGPFHTFGVGTWSGVTYSVDTVSNSTITNLSFSAATKSLSFNVTGPNGTIGFCRLAIPLSLMSGEWIVIVNGTSISYSTIPYGNYTYIYFTYHHSTETVKITSTSVIPEFRPSMLLPLFMIITLIGAIIFKRKRKVRK